LTITALADVLTEDPNFFKEPSNIPKGKEKKKQAEDEEEFDIEKILREVRLEENGEEEEEGITNEEGVTNEEERNSLEVLPEEKGSKIPADEGLSLQPYDKDLE
jgi:hypothetical protein